MFIHYRTQGFILKKEDRGEADQLLTIYTKDFGKLEILGRAIRKISSKLRSSAEIFYLSEIEFIEGKTYKTLTDAILIDKFENIRRDLGKLKIAYQISEVFDSLIRGQEKDDNIWNLLINTFGELSNQKLKIKNQLIYYYFLWKLFSFLGYRPQLSNCFFCQKRLSLGKLYFNFKEGGILCPICFKKIKKGKLISPELIKILRFILEKDWPEVKKLKIDIFHLKDLKKISDSYLSFLPKLNLSQD